MSRIGLIEVDGGKTFPNLALMKISAYHKSIGDEVSWYYPFDTRYDKVYMSKVFSFTPDYDECINADEVVKGGTGYAISLVNGVEVFDKSKDVLLAKLPFFQKVSANHLLRNLVHLKIFSNSH